MHNTDTIALRVTNKGADRATLVGTTGTGKSTLAAELMNVFHNDYPDSRIEVHDTKPRWRAEYLADGSRADRRYRKMAKGDLLPGSMALERPQDWSLVWDRHVNPSQIVVVQNLQATQRANVIFQTWCAERFFRTQDAHRPSLIYFDEGMDFFNTNASAKGSSDIVQRCYRAGREMNLCTLFGTQRPKGINPQIMSECNYLALFALDNRSDVRHLHDYGWPRTILPPTMHDPEACTDSCTVHDPDGTFRLWRKGHTAPKYRLAIDNEGRKAA